MKAVRVREEEAETIRQKLLSEGAIDNTRKLVRKGGFIEIPVKDSAVDFNVIEQEEPEFYIPKKTLCNILDIPEHEKKLLPSGWQLLGDVIIITLREETQCTEERYRKSPIIHVPWLQDCAS